MAFKMSHAMVDSGQWPSIIINKLKLHVSKGMLPNFDPLDEKWIVGAIDFWMNFLTHQSVYNIKNTQLDD